MLRCKLCHGVNDRLFTIPTFIKDGDIITYSLLLIHRHKRGHNVCLRYAEPASLLQIKN